MKILSIETSCDETAISILEVEDRPTKKQANFQNTKFKILSNNLISQIEIHKEFGGVFPALAKREHSKNLIPLLRKTLAESELKFEHPVSKFQSTWKPGFQVEKILEREPELLKMFLEYILPDCKSKVPSIEIPDIDAIAVTQGPGLEPALWVGINFAKALALVWDKPLIPVNHMEGHLFSSFIQEDDFEIPTINFPAIALLISGGHTELILVKKWGDYEKIGQSLDDAVGEAFDKVARMLDLPYPGGPEISNLAEIERTEKLGTPSAKLKIKLPRPMLNTDDFNFSFSGLKTAVLYLVKNLKKKNNGKELPQEIKQKIALEFEEATTEVLLKKTQKALEKYNAKTCILGGGVTSNKHICQSFQSLINQVYQLEVWVPEKEFSTDNSLMIGVAGYFSYLTCLPVRQKNKEKNQLQSVTGLNIRANGNLSIDSKNNFF